MISWFEIARLAERKRILFEGDISTWIDDLALLPRITTLPLPIEVAVKAARLPPPINDPIDRIIVATALHHRVPLVTKDHKIVQAGVVETIW